MRTHLTKREHAILSRRALLHVQVLLDDVLAELDPTRQQLLLEAVGESHQCLVSATHLEGFGGGWQQQAQILRARELRPNLKIG